MLASSVGPYNAGSNDYLQLNAVGIDYVMLRGVTGFYTIDDFEWNAGTATIDCEYTVLPSSGTLPFSVQHRVTLTNLNVGGPSWYRRVHAVGTAGSTHGSR